MPVKDQRSVFEGGCLCGKIRFRAHGGPRQVNHCHCEMCRRASGAPFVTWATFATRDVEWIGAKPSVRRSSDIAVRSFCPTCGSPLAWQADKSPDLVDLTAGTFDDPSNLRPREHIWAENRIRWVHLADDLPRYKTDRKSPLLDD